MGMMRGVLLWASRSQKLREALPRYRFIRKAVRRFMPGETLEDAILAANELKAAGFPTIFTYLGENIASEAEAKAVVDHYLLLLRRIKESAIDCHLSVKLTQLGIDLSEQLCVDNLSTIVRSAKSFDNFVWIDMEGSPYVDPTIGVFRRLRGEFANVGLCLQSYLFRTVKDLEELTSLLPMIRLVKGAYSEPPDVAFPEKSDVDKNYLAVAKMLLSIGSGNGVRQGMGTHDRTLIRELQEYTEKQAIVKDTYEFQMLYGIQVEEQQRLIGGGARVRILISYGTFWFPWYMRRLAERPANVLFVLKSLFR